MPVNLHPGLPVLLIDDEEIMLKSYKRALNFSGINNIVLCQDSRNAMDVLAQQKIGVILLDLLMPHLSGEELLSLISRDYPEIPILIITGIREVETAVQCMRANAYDYLVKPVDEDRLLNAVHRAIEYREMKEEIRFLKRGLFSD
ncbi:MAG: response regulator, partial [Actinobacteria bacterium]|nr:response regulator [Actinomycetota bacterium]